MPEGFLTPHQSSHVSGNSGAEAEPGESSVFTSAVLKVPVHEPIYGTAMIDVWDKVRFSVELTRIDPLEGVFSLDIRRFKGNLKSYKFLYDTIRE
jgi:protein-serine/threonine kinase